MQKEINNKNEIKSTQSKNNIDNNQNITIIKTSPKNIVLWTIMIFAIIMWCSSLLRVPYLGTFLDSVLFEFTLGWAKYFLYAITLIYILCIKFIKLRKIFCIKKRIFWYFVPIFIISILMNTIQCYQIGYNVLMAKQLYIGPDGYITKWIEHYWDNTVLNFKLNYIISFIPQSYSYGGIIGLFIVTTATYFSPIIIIIILVIWFVIYSFIFFSKKHKNKRIHDILKMCMIKEDEKKPKNQKDDYKSID